MAFSFGGANAGSSASSSSSTSGASFSFSSFGGFGSSATSSAATSTPAATAAFSFSSTPSTAASTATATTSSIPQASTTPFSFTANTSAGTTSTSFAPFGKPAATTANSNLPSAGAPSFGSTAPASFGSGFGATGFGTTKSTPSTAAAPAAIAAPVADGKPTLGKGAALTSFNAGGSSFNPPSSSLSADGAKPSFGTTAFAPVAAGTSSTGGNGSISSATATAAKSLFAAAALPAPSNLAPTPTFTTKPVPSVSFNTPSSSSAPSSKSNSSSVSLSMVIDAAQSNDPFASNVKSHPLWRHLASIGSFTLPTPPSKSSVSDNPSSPAKKDTPLNVSQPFESRLAASYSGTIFCLAPPPLHGTIKHARLFTADMKTLKTTHPISPEEQLKHHESVAPAFRELICTPTPLPAHSHTITLNSQATYAAVHSTNTVYLVCIASNKLEKAVLYADSSNGPHQTGVKVKSAAVGSWFHQNNTTLQILQVSFHPLSDIHLLILTNDAVLRVYNIKENLNLPIKEFSLNTISQLTVPSTVPGTAAMSRMGSRKGSGIWSAGTPGTNRSISMTGHGASSASGQHGPKPMVVAFTFGSQPATRNAAASHDHNGWDIFSIYFLFSNGHITLLCPYVPPQVSIDRRLVVDLIRVERQQLDDLNELVSTGTPGSDIEYEQIESRLVWLSQTFGHVDESPAASTFVVTKDMGTHELAQGWIQPAQSCGAQWTPQQAATLSTPTLFAPTSNPSGGSSSPYPYPACHLFAFRHAGIQAPGRFFRGFVDGRVDLLLRLLPVRPFFAVPTVRALCEELDDLATTHGTGVHTFANSTLDEVASLFAAGGCYENYSISTLLVPVDMSKIDHVELPVQPALVAPPNSGGYSRSGLGLSSPGMMRAPSAGFDRSPSFSRIPSAGAGVAATNYGASPLQLFLPQYRPLIDLYDTAGLFFVTPHNIRALSYGDQIDQVAQLLAQHAEAPDSDLFASVQAIFADMQSAQKAILNMDYEEKVRRLVGCVLLNDPLIGKYIVHLSSTTNEGPLLNVIELVRPQQKPVNVKKLLEAADAAVSESQAGVSIRTNVPSPDSVALDSTLTPFADEIAPFLAKLRNFQPPAGFTPGIAGNAGSLLNSPEALGEFLRIRKSYVETIHDLTLMRTLIRSRIAILGRFCEEQQTMFDQVEKSIVACRATQAMLDDKLKLHQEMQQHLGDAVQSLSSDLTLHLTDLSPAEIAFHQQLITLHSQSIPQLHHKLAEYDRKSRQIQQIQREMKQAAKIEERKGLVTPDTKTVWSEKQIELIKPIIANQSSAINALVQQMADLHKTMTTLRSHPAWQQRRKDAMQAPPSGQKLLKPSLNDSNELDQPL